MRVHKGKALLAGVAAIALALTACSSSGGGGNSDNNNTNAADPTAGTAGTGNLAKCATEANTCGKADTKPGGSFTYTIEKTITGWNLNSVTSNTFDFAEVLDGVLPGAFIGTPDLKATLNTDLLESAEQTKADPQTLVYKIKPNAVWNDGKPINADDFDYAWRTQNGVDCPGVFDKDGNPVPGKGCPAASNSGYSEIASLTGSDNGKTVTVVMKHPYTDWKIMFGTMYPAHIAAQHGGTKGNAGLTKSFAWFDTTKPTYSGGPYQISNFVKDTSVTEVPNQKWYGATKPSLDRLIFQIITKQEEEIPALQNKEVQGIYPQPNQDIVQQAKGISGVDTYLGKGLTWEHLDFNEKNPILKDKQLRLALFTAIDRKQIITRTIGQFVNGAQPLNNHMYMPGQDGYADNVSATGQGSGDVSKAKDILKAAGYTGIGSALKSKTGAPITIRCSFTAGNLLRQQTCQVIQNQLKQLGVTVKVTPIPSLGATLSTGDFDLILFAWVGAPFIFAGAQQTWLSTSGSNYGHNVNKEVDRLLNEAAATPDPSLAKTNTDKADKALTADAYVLPLFQKPTFLAVYSNMANVRDDATSTGPPYNVQEWGLRAS